MTVIFATTTGCIPSLNPIYDEECLVFEPAILGAWQEADSTGQWLFKKSEGDSYVVTYTDKDGLPGRFEGHLANLNGTMFLDLFPEEPQINANDFYKWHLFPVHTFYLVERIEPTLSLRSIDPNWLDEFLRAERNAIKHERVEGMVVLTADTDELQKFYLAHLQTEGAFAKPLAMTRVENSSDA